MTQLIDLPNIGKNLAERLERADIASVEKLKELGTEEVAFRVNTVDKVCINSVYAIEGAIQGIRWHHLSKERNLKSCLRRSLLKGINLMWY